MHSHFHRQIQIPLDTDFTTYNARVTRLIPTQETSRRLHTFNLLHELFSCTAVINETVFACLDFPQSFFYTEYFRSFTSKYVKIFYWQR